MQMDCRLILDPPASGVRNMSADEALLLDAADRGTATLRFYSWSEPTLSLGYFQNYSDRETHASSRACAVVRRQTGGGAILHDRELTYSIALPPAHPLTKQNEQLYQIVHRVFVETLSLTSAASTPPSTIRIHGTGPKLSPSDEPFLCFERRSPGDVVFVPDPPPDGTAKVPQAPLLPPTRKVLGSAQRRYHGAVLQHGSLLLERSPAAPELPGWSDLVDPNVSVDALISAVSARLAEELQLRLHRAKLPAELELITHQIANNKYGSLAWTNRR